VFFWQLFIWTQHIVSDKWRFTRGADNSLARPTARCRSHEIDSVVGRRGSVHVPNYKSFLVTEAERKHVRRRARLQNIEMRAANKVFFLQGKDDPKQ
jgi:hypothetical protein